MRHYLLLISLAFSLFSNGQKADTLLIQKHLITLTKTEKYRNYKNLVQLNQVATIKTKKFAAPKGLTGIDFSDHLNYWKMGFSAMMLTDTSFYRNKNYHEPTDTLETLDIFRMAQVIDGVLQTLVAI